jgi:putative sigma-54 modulation protein
VRTIVTGKNIDVPDTVRHYAERKMGRLERFLDDRTDAILELSVERHRSADDSRIAEVTLVIDGQTLRGRAEAMTYEAAIDEVADKVERRAVDHKEKPRVRARAPEEKGILRRIANGTADAGPDGRRVVKSKRFAIEPMFEEDAITAMESLGHAFYVFVNAENEHINVLYRRDDGAYGLIEPMVAGGYTQGGPRSAPARASHP